MRRAPALEHDIVAHDPLPQERGGEPRAVVHSCGRNCALIENVFISAGDKRAVPLGCMRDGHLWAVVPAVRVRGCKALLESRGTWGGQGGALGSVASGATTQGCLLQW